jgi:hypothetical protein
MPRAATVVRGLSNQKRKAGKAANRKGQSADLLQDLVCLFRQAGRVLTVVPQCSSSDLHVGRSLRRCIGLTMHEFA